MKILKIENCTQCSHSHEVCSYSLDGFDGGSDWFCRHPEVVKLLPSKSDRKVGSFIERASEYKYVKPLNVCPLEGNKVTENLKFSNQELIQIQLALEDRLEDLKKRSYPFDVEILNNARMDIDFVKRILDKVSKRPFSAL